MEYMGGEDYDIGDCYDDDGCEQQPDVHDIYQCPICENTQDETADDSVLVQCPLCHNMYDSMRQFPAALGVDTYDCPWCLDLKFLADRYAQLWPWRSRDGVIDETMKNRRSKHFIAWISFLRLMGVEW